MIPKYTQSWFDYLRVDSLTAIASSPVFKAIIAGLPSPQYYLIDTYRELFIVFCLGEYYSFQKPGGPAMIHGTLYPVTPAR